MMAPQSPAAIFSRQCAKPASLFFGISTPSFLLGVLASLSTLRLGFIAEGPVAPAMNRVEIAMASYKKFQRPPLAMRGGVLKLT